MAPPKYRRSSYSNAARWAILRKSKEVQLLVDVASHRYRSQPHPNPIQCPLQGRDSDCSNRKTSSLQQGGRIPGDNGGVNSLQQQGDGFLATTVELTHGGDGGANPVGDGGVAPSIQSTEAGGESQGSRRGGATHGRPTVRAQRRVPPWLEDPTSPVQADAGGDPLPSDAMSPSPLSSLFLPLLPSPSHPLSRSLSLLQIEWSAATGEGRLRSDPRVDEMREGRRGCDA